SVGSLAFDQAQPSPHVLVAQVVELLAERRGVQLGPDQPARRAGGRRARDRHLGELEAQGEEPQVLRPEPEPDPPGAERPVHDQGLTAPRALLAVCHRLALPVSGGPASCRPPSPDEKAQHTLTLRMGVNGTWGEPILANLPTARPPTS